MTVKAGEHERQKEFQKSARFRPRVEAKFVQLKNVLGYDRAESCGLDCMCLQGAMIVFVANVLRILTPTQQKDPIRLASRGGEAAKREINVKKNEEWNSS